MFDFIKRIFTGSDAAVDTAKPLPGAHAATAHSEVSKVEPRLPKPTGDALIRASHSGDILLVQSLLDHGANVNAKGLNDWTALIAASTKGRHKIVQLLLSKGADVNACTSDGETALVRASAQGHREIVAALIVNGANVNASGGRAIKFASEGGHREVVEMLSDKGADRELFRIWCRDKADAEKYVATADDQPLELMMALAMVSNLSERAKAAVLDSRRRGRYEIRRAVDQGEQGFALVFFF